MCARAIQNDSLLCCVDAAKLAICPPLVHPHTRGCNDKAIYSRERLNSSWSRRDITFRAHDKQKVSLTWNLQLKPAGRPKQVGATATSLKGCVHLPYAYAHHSALPHAENSSGPDLICSIKRLVESVCYMSDPPEPPFSTHYKCFA